MSRAGPAGEVEVAGPVLPALVREWCPEAREWWEERAAVLEYDARMVRSRAEKAAEDMARTWWARNGAGR